MGGRFGALVFAALLLIAGCVNMHGVNRVRLIGYLSFEGEFRLFANQQDYEQFPGRCTSFTFNSDARIDAAKALVSRHVVVEGRLVPWTAGATSLKFGGATLTNSCGVTSVLFARSIRTVDDTIATAAPH